MKLSKEYIKSNLDWGQDPNFVIGFDGKPIKKLKVIQIKGKFYEKEVTALFLRGSWYKHNDSQLSMDNYTGKLDVRKYLKSVIIDKNGSSGYVSKKTPSVICQKDDEFSRMEVMNEEIAIELGFVECLNSGIFFSKGIRSPYYDHKRSPEFFTHSKDVQTKEGIREANIPYNTKYGISSHTFIKSEGKEYTFGVEMETSTGVVTKHVYMDKFNLSCVRDGSVTGGEYVTGILRGDQGFIHLRKICRELIKRCSVNDRTGVHVHVGGFLPNKEFTIYSFILGHLLQDDLFAMLPASRRASEYSRPFDLQNPTYKRTLVLLAKAENEPKIGYQATINEAYEEVFKWLSLGTEPGDSCNKYTSHPQGRYCGGRSSPRYKWLNLICTNFTGARFDDHYGAQEKPPSWTIEFRNHSGTLSYKKIEGWILICFAFVWFVEDRQRYILEVVTGKRTIRLENIIELAYPKGHPALLRYISDRTHLFSGKSADVDFSDVPEEGESIKTFLTENFKPIKDEPKRLVESKVTEPELDLPL